MIKSLLSMIYNSSIISAATVESLLKQLTHDNRQIMMWDELKTWQTSLGLYKSGSASDYDTTIYLTAYNGGSLKRQTCNSKCDVLHNIPWNDIEDFDFYE